MSGARKLTHPQPWRQDLAVDLAGAKVDSSCIGVADCLEPEAVLTLALDSGFTHICQKGGHLFDAEIESANLMIQSPESFLEFPSATILTPGALSAESEKKLIIHDTKFNSSSDKLQVLTAITNMMELKGLSQTINDDVIAVADELFTNAIFNAPFVDKDTHQNPGICRKRLDVKLDDGKFGRMFLANDEKRLVIGCEDPYGSLDLKRYMTKIKATYQRGPAATINFGPGGAGIGSYIIFNAGSSLYFGVWPGKASIVCCVIPLGMSNRKRIQLSKHVHLIHKVGG
jgi:hypothetical protein